MRHYCIPHYSSDKRSGALRLKEAAHSVPTLSSCRKLFPSKCLIDPVRGGLEHTIGQLSHRHLDFSIGVVADRRTLHIIGHQWPRRASSRDHTARIQTRSRTFPGYPRSDSCCSNIRRCCMCHGHSLLVGCRGLLRYLRRHSNAFSSQLGSRLI